MQPGETITPGGQPPAPPQPPAQTPPPPQAAKQPAEAPPDSSWQFRAENPAAASSGAAVPAAGSVRWSASEYIAHSKSGGWYGLLALGILGAVLLTLLISREIMPPVVVGMVGVIFGVFAARPPRVLEYVVDSTGVHVGGKLYSYGQFKTFSIIEESGVHSILLMPLQRFGMPLMVYYELQNEEEIVTVLGSYLPHEDRQVGAIDNLMRKIRF
jgi:hypothetical protein